MPLGTDGPTKVSEEEYIDRGDKDFETTSWGDGDSEAAAGGDL